MWGKTSDGTLSHSRAGLAIEWKTTRGGRKRREISRTWRISRQEVGEAGFGIGKSFDLMKQVMSSLEACLMTVGTEIKKAEVIEEILALAEQ